MSRFEDNLWNSVVDEHGDELARHDGPTGPPPRGRRPTRLVAGVSVGAAVAAAAVVAVVAGGAANPSPAWAVTLSHNGAVSVKVNNRAGIAAANRRLAKLGVKNRVTDVTHGQSVQVGWSLPASGCAMYQSGKPPVTVQLSAAQQQADIHDGIYTPPATTGNTGGPSQNGPWHVVYCRADANTKAPTSANMGWGLPTSGCWMYEDGHNPITLELSAAQQQSEIHNGIWTDPYSGEANNTGGPPQNGPWHVIYCQTSSGNTGNTGAVAPVKPARRVTASARRDAGSGNGADQTFGLPASGCWMYEDGKPPVTVQLTAAQQQADIHDGIFTPPASSGNTGGPPQDGPWHVVYCRSGADTKSPTSANMSWSLPASGCWMYEPGKNPVTVQLSAAQQQADIHDGIFTPSASSGNTGGPPQNGPWHVIYCRTSSGSGSGTA